MRRSNTIYSATILLLLTSAATVSAADDTVASLPEIAGPGVATLLLNLVLVLAVIAICGWLLSRGQRHLGSASDDLKVVATKALGNRERIVVIQVGEQQLLLGVTATAVNHLHTLSEPLNEQNSVPAIASAFSARLKKVMGRNENGASS